VRATATTISLFGSLVVDGWCWFVLREKYCWLVAGVWFVLREKHCWLVADKPSEQAAYCPWPGGVVLGVARCNATSPLYLMVVRRVGPRESKFSQKKSDPT
jgi:hypothetical protein